MCYNVSIMKRVIEVEDLCCKRCAERAEKKLLLLDGVSGAKANFKRNIIFVEPNFPTRRSPPASRMQDSR